MFLRASAPAFVPAPAGAAVGSAMFGTGAAGDSAMFGSAAVTDSESRGDWLIKQLADGAMPGIVPEPGGPAPRISLQQLAPTSSSGQSARRMSISAETARRRHTTAEGAASELASKVPPSPPPAVGVVGDAVRQRQPLHVLQHAPKDFALYFTGEPRKVSGPIRFSKPPGLEDQLPDEESCSSSRASTTASSPPPDDASEPTRCRRPRKPPPQTAAPAPPGPAPAPLPELGEVEALVAEAIFCPYCSSGESCAFHGKGRRRKAAQHEEPDCLATACCPSTTRSPQAAAAVAATRRCASTRRRDSAARGGAATIAR
mmetsp:Transcript_28017/g.80387  ORF Transcript_28017/g.80387 Transcript_28017/m.80387 type:complete len:315 (-) Transcript_28017:95-1039(-)